MNLVKACGSQLLSHLTTRVRSPHTLIIHDNTRGSISNPAFHPPPSPPHLPRRHRRLPAESSGATYSLTRSTHHPLAALGSPSPISTLPQPLACFVLASNSSCHWAGAAPCPLLKDTPPLLPGLPLGLLWGLRLASLRLLRMYKECEQGVSEFRGAARVFSSKQCEH